MSEKQYRDKIASIQKQQATDETALAKARGAAAKHRADSARELGRIGPPDEHIDVRVLQKERRERREASLK